MTARSLLLRGLAPALLASALAAAPAAAQQTTGGHAGHGATPAAGAAHGAHAGHAAGQTAGAKGGEAHHAASGWKEMDLFHELMMVTWHPAKRSNDLRPIREHAAHMADAARTWAAAAVPAACDNAETRATIARLATDSRALADLVARPASTDAEVLGALKALHDRFEPVEHGCAPGGAKHDAKHGAKHR